MKKTLFTLTLTLLLMVTLCLTVSAQSWQISRVLDFGAGWKGAENLEFSGKNVLFFNIDDRIYKCDLSIGSYWWKDVGSKIIELDIPEEDPFYVAYLKENGKVGMRYTDDLSWRGGFKRKYGGWTLMYELAVSANGDSLVVGSGRYVEKWDVSSPSARYKGRIRLASGREIQSLAMSDSGNYIFVADWNDNIDKWRFTKGHVRVFRTGNVVRALKYSDGILASWAPGPESIDLWDTNNSRFLRTLRGSARGIAGVIPDDDDLSFSENRNAPYLATVHSVGRYEIKIWNVESGALLDNIKQGGIIESVALNSDGTRLAVSDTSWERTVYIYHMVGAAAPAATPQAALPPAVTTLLSNYPNPFNPETWIPYQLATPAEVTVSIHAADGKLVRTLALGQLPAGVYQDKERAAYWDGTNEQGEPVASGVYFYTLKAGDFSATKKMLIRK